MWAAKDQSEVNRATGLADVVRALDADAVAAAYQHDRAIAPRRADRDRSYLVGGHDAIPSSGTSTNHVEEHLMLALSAWCARGGRLVGPGGGPFRVVAYQVPLKARRLDPVGKVDGVALLGDGRCCLVELKAPNGRGDSPLQALLEVLSYAAVIDANRAAFDKELVSLHPEAITGGPLTLLVLGPNSWWEAWESCPQAGAWKAPLRELSAALGKRIGVRIGFGALDGFQSEHLTLGLNRTMPTLEPIPRILDVPSLPSVATDASTTPIITGGSYVDQLVVRMHSYAHERFDAALFETGRDPHRPPVFLAEHATSNLLLPPDADLASSVVKMVPVSARHRWFRSMKSSQALTQSVFGALAATGHLAALGALTAECGRSAFTETPNLLHMTLEQHVNWLGEPRPTSIDVYLERSQYRIAVECKLSESVFGACSRPRLPRDNPSYCDGTYTVQHGRRTRCALTEIGVQYWQHAPAVFNWNPDIDHSPCPLAWTYQLVRNVLAATVRKDRVETASGHALIIYDERNPAFWPGGDARSAYDAVCKALRHPCLLRTVSWQRVIDQLSAAGDLRWLVDGLEAKYGLTNSATVLPETVGGVPGRQLAGPAKPRDRDDRSRDR